MKNSGADAVFICGLLCLFSVFPPLSAAESIFCLRSNSALRTSTENRNSDEQTRTTDGYLCALRDGTNPEVVVPLLTEALANGNFSLAHFGTNVEEIVLLVALYYDKQSAELSREALRARRSGTLEPERFYERLGEISLKKHAMISRAKYLFDPSHSSSPVKTSP